MRFWWSSGFFDLFQSSLACIIEKTHYLCPLLFFFWGRLLFVVVVVILFLIWVTRTWLYSKSLSVNSAQGTLLFWGLNSRIPPAKLVLYLLSSFSSWGLLSGEAVESCGYFFPSHLFCCHSDQVLNIVRCTYQQLVVVLAKFTPLVVFSDSTMFAGECISHLCLHVKKRYFY